ncbi:MAG: DUF5106 domain-containing protein [Tidjanibacter sp.]|nr:DUF5106 domain-containing protein [Tidjanibacter sp.]
MKHLSIITLAFVLLLTACGGEKRRVVGYWDDFNAEAVLDNVTEAEADFREWCELLLKVDSLTQQSAIEELVAKVCVDEVCFYVYTEWAMSHLYGLWSPLRNEYAFEHLLRTLLANVDAAQDNSREFARLLDILTHNRVGEEALDFDMFSPEGERGKLSDYRGERVVLLLVDITCPSCVDIMASVEAQREIMALAERGELTLVAVAVGQVPENIDEFVARHEGSLWNIHCALRNDVESAYYDTTASPALYLIDAEGRMEVGMSRYPELIVKGL